MSIHPTPERQKQVQSTRVPHSFFYDRVVPALLAVLALALLIVIALVIGALSGLIPVK
jgi:hypothetical protein